MPEPTNGAAPNGGAPNAGAAGGSASPWYGALPADAPQEFQQWVGTKNFPDAQSALNSAFNLEKLLGADRANRTVVLPKDANDAEGLKAFRAKIGVPDSPEGYGLKPPEGGDGTFEKVASGWFHARGLTAEQARGISEDFTKHFMAELQRQDDAAKTKAAGELEQLRAKWGNEFEAKGEMARRFMAAAGFSESEVQLYEEVFGTANMLERFQNLGAKLGEPNFAANFNSATGGPGNSAQANQRLNDLRRQRIDGQITQEEFIRQANEIGLAGGARAA